MPHFSTAACPRRASLGSSCERVVIWEAPSFAWSPAAGYLLPALRNTGELHGGLYLPLQGVCTPLTGLNTKDTSVMPCEGSLAGQPT